MFYQKIHILPLCFAPKGEKNEKKAGPGREKRRKRGGTAVRTAKKRDRAPRGPGER
jgi:hypothetical protein